MATLSSDRATLLGIPPELRLRIYDYAIGLYTASLRIDEDGGTANPGWCFGYEETCSFTSGYRTVISRRVAGSLPSIPWLSLQSTCSTIRDECRGYARSLTFANAAVAKKYGSENAIVVGPCPWYHTYEMSITAQRTNLSGVEWTSLPCAPSQCRSLTVNIAFGAAVKFWGCGGPTPIVRDLYQALNRFLHYGPVLDARATLAQPLRLEVLRVILRAAPGETEDGDEDSWTQLRAAGNEICALVREIEETGLLDGLVGSVLVLVDGGDDRGRRLAQDVTVERREEEGKVPSLWDNYGFEWGVAAAQTERG